MYSIRETAWLDMSYQMYLDAYDREVDDKPPLSRNEWERAYGEASLKDLRAYGEWFQS